MLSHSYSMYYPLINICESFYGLTIAYDIQFIFICEEKEKENETHRKFVMGYSLKTRYYTIFS